MSHIESPSSSATTTHEKWPVSTLALRAAEERAIETIPAMRRCRAEKLLTGRHPEADQLGRVINRTARLQAVTDERLPLLDGERIPLDHALASHAVAEALPLIDPHAPVRASPAEVSWEAVSAAYDPDDPAAVDDDIVRDALSSARFAFLGALAAGGVGHPLPISEPAASQERHAAASEGEDLPACSGRQMFRQAATAGN